MKTKNNLKHFKQFFDQFIKSNSSDPYNTDKSHFEACKKYFLYIFGVYIKTANNY